MQQLCAKGQTCTIGKASCKNLFVVVWQIYIFCLIWDQKKQFYNSTTVLLQFMGNCGPRNYKKLFTGVVPSTLHAVL